MVQLLADPPHVDAAPRLGFRPALDGIRAIALLAIFWHHTLVGLKPSFLTSVTGGFVGVDLFFVLSGFLITTLILERVADHGRVDLKNFYVRRANRLLPALLVYLVVHGVVALVMGNDLGTEVKTTLAALTYTSNYAMAFDVHLAGTQVHLWTLAVEEQFYLLWPLAMVWLSRRRPWLVLRLLAFGLVAVAVWRYVLTGPLGTATQSVYYRTDARADALLIGAALAFLLRAGWNPGRRLAAVAGVAGAATWTWLFLRPESLPVSMFSGGFSLVALACVAIVLGAVRAGGAFERVLSWRPLVAIGRVSYSLYLWHVLLFVLALEVFGADSPLRYVGAYALTAVCGVVSFRYIEQPMLQRVHSNKVEAAATSADDEAAAATEPAARPAAAIGAGGPRVKRPFLSLGAALAGFAVVVSGVGAYAVEARERRGDVGPGVALEADPGAAAPGGTAGDAPPEAAAAAEEEAGSSPESSVGDGGDGDGPGPSDQVPTAQPATPEDPAADLVATTIDVLPPLLGDVLGEVALTATLRTVDGAGVAGVPVELVVRAPSGEVSCTAPTSDLGVASCAVAAPQPILDPTALEVVARFAGTDRFGASEGALAALASG